MLIKFLKNKLIKEPTNNYIYNKFKDYTMIDKELFLSNISLVSNHFKHNRDLLNVIECGVWRGGMIAAIAEVLGNQHHYFLFDSFEGLPNANEIDGVAASKWQKNINSPIFYDNCKAEESYAIDAMQKAQISNYQIYKGWFENTVPLFSEKKIEISVLRLDGDWYDSTMVCLDYFYPLVKRNGLIIIDDYFAWDGCSIAVHDYLSKIRSKSRIKTEKHLTYIIKNEDGRIL